MEESAIHLTNDAIQKYLPDYGKYEKGNKLSYDQIDAYVQKNYQGKSFYGDIYPEMMVIVDDNVENRERYHESWR